MEGIQPDTPPAPSPEPSRRSGKRLVFFVIVVEVVVVVATVSVYVLTRRPPIPLTVSDGSTTGIIEGNFANVTDTRYSIVRYFNATTYANQSRGPTSTLSLLLFTYTYSDGTSAVVNIWPTVVGRFASNLHLSVIGLAYNQSGTCIGTLAAAFPNRYDPVNVSYNGASVPGFNISGPASDGLTTTPLNQTGNGPFYEFVYPSVFTATPCLGTNHLLTFRATVTGSFTPSVSVGIQLQVTDVPP